MYSRNYKGRNVRNVSGTGASSNYGNTGRRPVNDPSDRVIVPPSYGGTLYISAVPQSSGNTEKKPETDIRENPVKKDAGSSENGMTADGYRTVMYNGEPYVPDEIGIQSSRNKSNVMGRGGHPTLDGGGELRFKGVSGRRAGDKSIRDTGAGNNVRAGSRALQGFFPESETGDCALCDSGMNLKSFLERMPPIDDIILIALIIALLGGRGEDAATDDVLIMILAVLLLFGKEKE